MAGAALVGALLLGACSAGHDVSSPPVPALPSEPAPQAAEPEAALSPTPEPSALEPPAPWPPAATPPSSPALVIPAPEPAPPAIASYRWVERSDGPSLFVEPTAWTRAGGPGEWDVAWEELVSLVPEADSQSMYEQFICHAIGAPHKETWNLEPWREAIGLIPLMLAACNL